MVVLQWKDDYTEYTVEVFFQRSNIVSLSEIDVFQSALRKRDDPDELYTALRAM